MFNLIKENLQAASKFINIEILCLSFAQDIVEVCMDKIRLN